MILLLLALSVPDLSGILKLSNGQTMAQACPTAMDRALTNKHVVSGGTRQVWGIDDGEKYHGLVEVDGTADDFRDLAVVKPVTAMRFPRWYPIAREAPKVGDKVWFVGYEFKSEKEAFAPKVFEAAVTRIFNGQLIYKPAGQPGSSGSCILNEQGETVAINQGGKDTGNNGEAGVGVAVWGNWLQLRPDEPPVEVEEPSPYRHFGAPFWRLRK